MIAEALRLALNLAEGRLLQVQLARAEIRELAGMAEAVSTKVYTRETIVRRRDEALGRLDEVEGMVVSTKGRLSEVIARMADQQVSSLPTFDLIECQALRLLVGEMGADDALGGEFDDPGLHQRLVEKLSGVPRG